MKELEFEFVPFTSAQPVAAALKKIWDRAPEVQVPARIGRTPTAIARQPWNGSTSIGVQRTTTTLATPLIHESAQISGEKRVVYPPGPAGRLAGRNARGARKNAQSYAHHFLAITRGHRV
jgi:hypothetical protein